MPCVSSNTTFTLFQRDFIHLKSSRLVMWVDCSSHRAGWLKGCFSKLSADTCGCCWLGEGEPRAPIEVAEGVSRLYPRHSCNGHLHESRLIAAKVSRTLGMASLLSRLMQKYMRYSQHSQQYSQQKYFFGSYFATFHSENAENMELLLRIFSAKS